MLDCDALLLQVMKQAERLGIPFSREIEPKVVINSRAVSRFGCCKYQKGRYTIEVAKRIAEGPENSCLEILAHELLHTCYGCRNHGKRWKGYAAKMNLAYGYHIQRVTTDETMGVVQTRPWRYVIRCEKCGAEIKRFRASSLTKHPERYRCKCGGKLRVTGGDYKAGR